jgi:pimeloyl-ACP methyl ester carboxylesterase
VNSPASYAQTMRSVLVVSLIVTIMVGCSPNGPLTTTVVPSSGGAQNSLAACVNPVNHVLAIDKRGNYNPIPFTVGDCASVFGASELRQPTPELLASEHCGRPKYTGNDQMLTKDQISNYKALDCHVQHIIEELTHSPAGSLPKHLVIFIHGGLVTQKDALKQAARDIPMMRRQSLMDPTLMSDGELFPLFFLWPSGFSDSYVDATLNYSQGEYNRPLRPVESPLYFATDVATTVARVPLDLIKSIQRFGGTYLAPNNGLSDWGWGCGQDIDPNHFGCNNLGSNQEPNPLDNPIYLGTFPLRLISVPALDTGTIAWKNMVARTRFGFEKYADPNEYRHLFDERRNLGPEDQKMLKEQKEILTRGAAYWFFSALKEKLSKLYPDQCATEALRITVIGHSMGALVINEMMQNFPDLPYENVVFMAAANSIRDFKAMTEPVLKNPRCRDLRFYNLSLHPIAEARDLELYGAAPVGSLLEWIDDIFETPVTPIERTMGKWENIIYAENEFDRDATKRMYFHRFGLRSPDPIMHGQFANPVASNCSVAHYWDPAYWSYVNTAKDGVCPRTVGKLVDIVPGTYGEPSK